MATKAGPNGVPRKAKALVEDAVRSGRAALLEYEAEQIAKLYRIPVAKAGLAQTERQALEISKRIGYPVVMKIVSPDIVHKTDVGGVIVNIGTPSDAKIAFHKILQNARRANRKADIKGIYIQKMAPKSYEFVVGATRDAQFGPTVMFGLGGIYVEIFKDVSFRLAPISEQDALNMMQETKSSKLLTGFRGAKPLDQTSAAKVIQSIGKIMSDFPQIDSIDVNPMFIYPKGVLATDVRIILEKKQES